MSGKESVVGLLSDGKWRSGRELARAGKSSAAYRWATEAGAETEKDASGKHWNAKRYRLAKAEPEPVVNLNGSSPLVEAAAAFQGKTMPEFVEAAAVKVAREVLAGAIA